MRPAFHWRSVAVSFLSDLTRVRSRARRHSAGGGDFDAATTRHDTVLLLLNDILASELLWLMRYRRRYLLWGKEPTVAEGRRAGEARPTTADRLAQRIVELGGYPDFDPDHLLSRNLSDFASRGSVRDMIREDLEAERIVIESYAEVIDYIGDADPSTREMLETNLSRERARAAQLSSILRDVETHTEERAG
jgi:bacterioferritin